MLVGQGGEGKSRIGVVMRSIFGDNMNNGNIAKVETNRFARADLENVLVMVDDDMKMEALPDTNYLKLIITAELPLDLERKGSKATREISTLASSASATALLRRCMTGARASSGGRLS